MKKSAKLFVAALGFALLLSGTAFAQQAKDNLIASPNLDVLPKSTPDYASPMTRGKAPSGKDAIIVTQLETNGTKEYRFRINFKEPFKLRGVTKLHIDWEAIDATLKSAGGAHMNASLRVLNADDNKALRAKTLDMAEHSKDLTTDRDKRCYFQGGNNGLQTFNAVFDLTQDAQGWGGITWDESTKQIIGLEVYVSDVGDGKGIAITNIWLE